MDAFISHKLEDAAFAAQVEKRLEDDGLEVWLDDSEIGLGALLRKELQTAIQDSRVLILLWSEPAAASRWVAAELLTAFHLDRFILPFVLDGARLPYFLQNATYLDLRRDEARWPERLIRAVREAPDAANEVPAMMSGQSPELQRTIQRIARGQEELHDRLGRWDLRGAREMHRLVDGVMVDAEEAWPFQSVVLNLAGYHRKNAYMLQHWEEIQAGRPPKEDSLLEDAERFFFDSLFANPTDYSALNGLGSILVFERDLDAAEFFIRRALALAEEDGIDYSAAKHDLAMVLHFKQP